MWTFQGKITHHCSCNNYEVFDDKEQKYQLLLVLKLRAMKHFLIRQEVWRRGLKDPQHVGDLSPHGPKTVAAVPGITSLPPLIPKREEGEEGKKMSSFSVRKLFPRYFPTSFLSHFIIGTVPPVNS